MESVDWTEIQTMICVARLGSLSAAARELAVNHSTVLRRIQAFEAKHQVTMFKRNKHGYQLSAHGQSLLQSFEQIERDMLSLQRRMTRYDSKLEGKLVITTTDTLFDHFFGDAIVSFSAQHPALQTQILVSNALVDMDHLQADIALRPTAKIPAGYHGMPLLTLEFYFYGHEKLRESLRAGEQLNQLNWLGYSGELASSRAGQLLSELMQRSPIFMANTFTALTKAAAGGLGLALLPSFIGDGEQKLHRLAAEPVFSTEVYLLTPEELGESGKIRSFSEFMAQYFNAA